MPVSPKVQSILERKGRAVLSISPGELVYAAIKKMADNSVGALLVMENERLVGIFSERDYARKVILEGKSSRETLVRDVMSSPVRFVSLDCTVEEAMSLMTDERIRHLPVVRNDRVVGVVSIGDLVRSIVHAQAEELQHLHAYITGKYPG